MGIFQLLADMMMFVLKAPFVLMKGVDEYSIQREMTQKGAEPSQRRAENRLQIGVLLFSRQSRACGC